MLHCPLCDGPVHEEEPGRYACAIDHEVGREALERHADLRLAEALWMAIEALDSEAEVLRVVGDGQSAGLADDAEKQAAILREFARRHAGRVRPS